MSRTSAYGVIGRNYLKFPLTSYPNPRIPARGIGGVSRISQLYTYKKPSSVSVNTEVNTLDAKKVVPDDASGSDFVKAKSTGDDKSHSLVPTEDNKTLEPTLKPIKLAEAEVRHLQAGKKRSKKEDHDKKSGKKHKKKHHHKFKVE